MKYKAWVWDFDGTLFNTYPNMTKAFGNVLESVGQHEKPEVIEKWLKKSLSEAIEHLGVRYLPFETFYNRFRAFESQGNLSDIEPFEGIERLLEAIQKQGGRHFIWTHRDEWTLTYLKHHKMEHYFEAVVTSDMGFKRKPSGEAMAYIIKKYQLQPETTLMVGDRELDILGARNAGVAGCLFVNGHEEKETTAEYVIHHYNEIDLDLF